ncbi:MAG: GDSL-type esterase/lipase family protein [Spirochaetales bacterium]
MGDSISIHYGPYLQEFLAGTWDYARKEGHAEAMVDLDDPQGANGGDSGRVLRYLQELGPTALAGRVLLLNCGLHDVRRSGPDDTLQVPLATYRANLKAAFALALAAAATIWVRTTPVVEAVHNRPGSPYRRLEADVAAYNRVADEVARELGVPCADLHGFTASVLQRLPAAEVWADHVHFTPLVSRLQASYLAGYLAGRFGTAHSPT